MRYEFIVTGSVPEDVKAKLPEMASTTYPTGGTALFGPLRAEADVLTMLARIYCLGPSVVEMRRFPDQVAMP